MNVNSLLEGASPLQHQQAESAKLANKWERSGLLEGLNGHESEKANMSVLLENQARQLVNEANQAGTGTSITAGSSEAWAGVALPLVRRVFGEIVAKDLVSVQPMNLPSGLIFYLDFQYGTQQPGDSTNALQAKNSSLYGASADLRTSDVPTSGAPGKGLYGAGRFGYSINEKSQALTADANNPVTPGTDEYVTGSAAATDWNYNEEFSASLAAGHTLLTVTVNAADLDNVDYDHIQVITPDKPTVNACYDNNFAKFM